jgi:hypothetical protein
MRPSASLLPATQTGRREGVGDACGRALIARRRQQRLDLERGLALLDGAGDELDGQDDAGAGRGVVEVDAVVPPPTALRSTSMAGCPMTEVAAPPSESTLACSAAPPLKARRKRLSSTVAIARLICWPAASSA